MKNCFNCGAQLDDAAKFCSCCGASQAAEQYNPGNVPPEGAEPDPRFGPQINQQYPGPGYQPGYAPQYGAPYSQPAFQPDEPSALVALLCFFFPIVGIVLYLVWKDTNPLKAKSAAKGAIAAVCVGAAIFVLSLIAVFVLAAARAF